MSAVNDCHSFSILIIYLGIYDVPTLLPHVMGFGNYFLQSSIGKLLNQLHAKRFDHITEHFETHREVMSPSTADSEGTEGTEGKESPAPVDPLQGLDAVRRILETVNTSVTKQLLEANVRKLSTSPATMKREFEEDYQVCNERFNQNLFYLLFL